MEQPFCELLRLQALPHLTKSGDSYPLQIEGMIPHVAKDGLPILLGKQIERLGREFSEADKIDYFTIIHNAKSLLDTEDRFITLDLLLQPYIFYDALGENSHKSNINSAIYTVESTFSENTLKSKAGNIRVNPSNIYTRNFYES